jgi:hypothetical protein
MKKKKKKENKLKRTAKLEDTHTYTHTKIQNETWKTDAT